MVHFGEFLKTWSLRPNSVTRQVTLNRTKIGRKCQNCKTLMRHFWRFFNGQNIYFGNSVVMKMVNHVLNLPKTFFVSSWIVVDGLGPQTLLTTQNQLMIAAMKTWEAIAEFWPDLPRIMDLIRQRKWSRWYTTFLIFKRGHKSFWKKFHIFSELKKFYKAF